MRGNPWVLITGASGELGRATAMLLAHRGFSLYLHYHQARAKLEPLLQYCEERGVSAVLLQADLRDVQQIRQLASSMPIPPLYLVNNASIDHVGLMQEVTLDQFDELIAANVRSAFFVTQLLLPPMLRERYGRIVNVSSIWGQTGSSCEVLYSLSKGAVLSFTKALAKELAPNGITVNAVAPGAIEGGMMERFSPEEIDWVSQDIPMGRLGKPHEVAAAIGFLLTDEASYLTGQVIAPNGGWYT